MLVQISSDVPLKICNWHRQVWLPCVNTAVDELCVPILTWINSFEGIVTTHSCQGGPAQTDWELSAKDWQIATQIIPNNYNPHVIIGVLNLNNFIKILNTLQELDLVRRNWTEISYSSLSMYEFPRFDISMNYERFVEIYDQFWKLI